MEYKIMLHTERKPEGFFWCIVDTYGANCGFGWEKTLDKAFSAAKTYLSSLKSKGV